MTLRTPNRFVRSLRPARPHRSPARRLIAGGVLGTVAASGTLVLGSAAPAAAAMGAEIIAHRGGTDLGLENSLRTFERAFDAGADAIEFDVQFTRDLGTVVMHDKTMNRTTNCSGTVTKITYAKFRSCELNDGTKTPNIYEALMTARDAGGNVYVHVSGLNSTTKAKKVARALNKYHLNDGHRATVMSSSQTSLRLLRDAGVERLGLVFTSSRLWDADWPVLVPYGIPVTHARVAEVQRSGRAVLSVQDNPVQMKNVDNVGLDGYVAEDLRDALDMYRGGGDGGSAGSSRPEIIGHRGGVDWGTENSVRTIRHAYASGADAVEIDVQFTKDRGTVIMHDKTMNRTTNCSGTVTKITYKKFRSCKLNDGTQAPNIYEALMAVRDAGKHVYVHVRGLTSTTKARKVMHAINKYDLVDQATIISTDEKYLARMVNAGAKRTGLLFRDPSAWRARHDVLLPYETAVTKSLVEWAQRNGSKVVVVEEHPTPVEDVLDLGLDGFMADGLQAALRELGAALTTVEKQLNRLGGTSTADREQISPAKREQVTVPDGATTIEAPEEFGVS